MLGYLVCMETYDMDDSTLWLRHSLTEQYSKLHNT